MYLGEEARASHYINIDICRKNEILTRWEGSVPSTCANRFLIKEETVKYWWDFWKNFGVPILTLSEQTKLSANNVSLEWRTEISLKKNCRGELTAWRWVKTKPGLSLCSLNTCWGMLQFKRSVLFLSRSQICFRQYDIFDHRERFCCTSTNPTWQLNCAGC